MTPPPQIYFMRTFEIHQQRPSWDVWEDGCPGAFWQHGGSACR